MIQENIQRAAGELYTKLMNTLLESIPQFRSLGDIEKKVSELVGELGNGLVSLAVKTISECFYESEARRDEHKLRVKQRGRKRKIYTMFGETELENDVYENMDASKDDKEKRYCSPVAEYLGIHPRQKVSTCVQRELVYEALFMSYRKSAEHVGDGTLSRQTVHRAVRDMEVVGIAGLPKGNDLIEVPELHIFIDEEHLSLQRDNRKSTIAPLAVLSEGFFCEGKDGNGRSRLVNPVYFSPSDLKSASLVDELASYILVCYDLTALKRVVVHGDGAGWIMKALKDHLDVDHALDGFHLTRAINKLVAPFCSTKKERSSLRRKIEKSIRKNDIDEFRNITNGFIRTIEGDEKALKSTVNRVKYIENNWDASRVRLAKGVEAVPGSCTEAQVQHFLSCRMSAVPCSWSRKCAGKIAALRAAMLNGVDITEVTADDHPEAFYTTYLKKQVNELLASEKNWDIFEKVQYNFDQDSGTQHQMQLIAAGGNVAHVAL